MSEPVKKPRIRVAEAVESGVEGLLVFLVRYFRTGACVLALPRRTWRRILADRHAPTPTFVLPLTYLSIGLFLLSLLGQVAGTSIVDWIWFIDELAGKVTEALSKEVSLVKVAVQALPGVLVVAGIAVILRLTLRRAPTSRRMVTFALSYAFGAQAWGLFLTAFSFVVLATVTGNWKPPGGAVGSALLTALIYGGVLGGLTLSFLGPLAFVLAALRWRRVWRLGRGAATVVAVAVVGAVLTGHVAVLAAMTLPAYVIARSASPNSPELRLGDTSYSRRDTQVDLVLRILLKNRGTKSQGWETAKMEVTLFGEGSKADKDRCSGDAYRFEVVRVLDGAGIATRYALVPPNETQWLAVEARIALNSQEQGLFVGSREWAVRAAMTSTEGDVAVTCSVMTVTAMTP